MGQVQQALDPRAGPAHLSPMEEFLIAHEALLRLFAFAGLLILFSVLEALLPRRARTMPRIARWSANLGLSVINTLLLRFAVPVLAVGVAFWAQDQGIGIFNLVALPWAVELIAALLLLDALIWAQHLVMHKVPLLWRLHGVHHTDRDLDATTALRFHPAEILVSMAIKIGAVALIGPSVAAVILFEVILNGMSLFNHACLRLPLGADRWLRWLIVTPDMHRIHHSVHQRETDSNYGFNLSIWDRLFGTYTADPRDGQVEMELGLTQTRQRPVGNLFWLLWYPAAESSSPRKGHPE